ncbi:DUF6503 family protein [Mesonia maritima]|uniref:Deoxyribose-phosphate aldolase n=1 Tax=Mesonia maritima TaxID=1793873 RepID=A0ABU1K3V5_9FLAO|nr:DUF6503 family protein [Mesonia maritima]MDR6300300.1 hypothetical protein [Mesonia maritima]
MKRILLDNRDLNSQKVLLKLKYSFRIENGARLIKSGLLLLLMLSVFQSCKKDEKRPDDNGKGAKIIDKVVENAGSENYDASTIEFTFRDLQYKSVRDCGMYELMRTKITAEGDTITDIVRNEGFTRLTNNETTPLADSLQIKYSNSVNSVHYFAQLPFGLNDQAVNKYYLTETFIKDKAYHEIEVTFDEIGGGSDHDDIYVYWVNTKTFTIDYFAYSYKTNGGGMRFREAFNPRTIKGIRFVDYKNYAPEEGTSPDLENMEKLFNENKLKQISTIETKNIEVTLSDKNCA